MAFHVGADVGGLFDVTDDRGVFFGGIGNDTLRGNALRQWLFGGHGNDSLVGAGGSDSLVGGNGRDTLAGGLGNDVLTGGGSFAAGTLTDDFADLLFGGEGNDLLLGGRGDTANGGAGNDRLMISEFGDFLSPELLALDFRTIGGATAVATGLGTQKAAGIESVSVELFAVAAGSTVHGSRGSDFIGVQIGFGGSGTDGVDLWGEDGHDTIRGSFGDDSLFGGNGNDVLLSGGGLDTVRGGAGADLFVGGAGFAPVSATRIADFAPASDMILLDLAGLPAQPASFAAVKLVANANPVASTATGAQFLYDTDDGRLWFDSNGLQAGGRTLIATLTGAPAITAANLAYDFDTSFNYQSALGLSLNWAPPPVAAAGVLRAGGTGNDSLAGAAGSDQLFGLFGNDSLSGLAGNDTLSGYKGNDTLVGGDQNDLLLAGQGADVAYGGNGNDTILTSPFAFPGDGLDRAFGGNGNDLIYLGRNDIGNGGAGTDVLALQIDMSAEPQPALPLTLNFSTIGAAAPATFGYGTTKAGGFESVTLNLSDAAAGTSVIGSAGDDFLFVDSIGTDAATGPTVRGGAGNDYIDVSGIGGVIRGEAGDDVLSLNDSSTVFGGAGSDCFAFSDPDQDAVARIMDFDTSDVILVSLVGDLQPNLTRLVSGAAPSATDPGLAQFLFNTTTKLLQLDVNGSLAGGLLDIAVLGGSSVAPQAHQLALEFAGDTFF